MILPRTPTHINTQGPSLKPLHSTPPPPHPQSDLGQNPPSLFQTCWKAGTRCTQLTPISPHLQAHRWFSRGGEDPAEALSTEVRLSFAAAARGDLKDSLFSLRPSWYSHTPGLAPLSLLPRLRRGSRVGEKDQTVRPPHPPNLHRSYSKQRAAIEREYGQVWDSFLWTFPFVLASFTLPAMCLHTYSCSGQEQMPSTRKICVKSLLWYFLAV